MNQGSHRKKAAFTVVELLVVLAIISFLLLLSLAGFDKVRIRAASVQCMQNLRTIGTGLNNYAADKGYYPSCCDSLSPSIYWYEALDPYITDARRGEKQPPYKGWVICPGRKHLPEDQRLGYGFNYGNFGDLPPESGSWNNPGSEYMAAGWHVRPQNVRAPFKKLIIADTADPSVKGEGWQLKFLYNSLENPRHARRHNGGGNYLFLDGHVEWMRPEEFWEKLRKDRNGILNPFSD